MGSGVSVSCGQVDGAEPLHRNMPCTHDLAPSFVEALKMGSPGLKKNGTLKLFPRTTRG